MIRPRDEWVLADFNGLFSECLCLSHGDTVKDLSGREIALQPGLHLTACEENYEDGEPDWLLATGTVEPSPDGLQCRGSKWVLRYDENGWHYESDLKNA